jgi:hypothetical protein
MLIFSLKNIINQNLLFMKNEISNGLTIEQLEERMEFTTMSLTAEQINAATAAGYSEADIANVQRCSGDGGGHCCHDVEGYLIIGSEETGSKPIPLW